MRIRLDAQAWGRSHFATSAAMEIVGLFRNRTSHPAPHARAWYQQARRALSADELALLQALIPVDHSYTPDFLTPVPRPGESMDDVVERIAATSAAEVDYHLDIAIRGRRVWPQVAQLHHDETAYERWRRPMPPDLAPLARRGGDAVAAASAQAMATLFESVLAPYWSRVRTVLEADIAYRADRMVGSGAAALFEELGDELSWTGTELVLARDYSGVVDWASDGVLFVPTTTHVGPVRFAAEQPHPPVLGYPARGVGVLWERPVQPGPASLGDLVGVTRASLLTSLEMPYSTHTLSRDSGLSPATVSYHLGILLRAGLVDRSRRGRVVLYRRTVIGSALATSTPG